MSPRIRLFLCLIVLLHLSACGIFTDDGETVERDNLIDPITLRLDQTVALGDALMLSFDALNGDSRCPEGVKCIWEGEIEADFSAISGKDTTMLVFRGFPYLIDSYCEDDNLLVREFGDYKIVLTQMDPVPEHPPVEVDSTEIQATIRVFPNHVRIANCEE